MGNHKDLLLVICFAFLGCWLYLTPFFLSFLTPSNLLASFLSIDGGKRIGKGRKEGYKDNFQLKTLFLGFYDYSVARKCLLGLLEYNRISQTKH